VWMKFGMGFLSIINDVLQLVKQKSIKIRE
jgi:heme exporter protein D